MLASLAGAAVAVLVAALPPPPDKVVRETRSYGTVTIDHRAHLALRVACKACHGPGRIGKIDFTPRSAHDTCRGCHTQIARGPTTCKGCHVVAPKKELVAAPADAPPSAEGTATAVAATTGPGAPMAPSHGPAPPAPIAPALSTKPTDTPFLRAAELGLTAIVGERQELVFGPSLLLTGRAGSAVVTYTMTHAGGTGDGRTQFLIGGGREFSLGATVRGTAVALGGLDATHDPVSAMPAVGLRGGIEWMIPRRWSIGFAVTALTDLLQRDSLGDRTGGTTVGITMSACHSLPWRSR